MEVAKLVKPENVALESTYQPLLPRKKRFRINKVVLLSMALPFIVMVFVFNYIPLFGWAIAFFDYKPGLPLDINKFVGLKYFIMALDFKSGSELLDVMRNTLVMSFLHILLTPLPAIFAILLSEIRSKYFKKSIQTITTLPNFISWVLVYAIFYAAFATDDGFINHLLLNLKLIDQPTSILTNSDIAWFFQTGVNVWKNVGFSAIIYLAAISGIDSELYDAVRIDGAGRYRKIIHVVIPGILSTYIVLLLLAISNMLSNGFEHYYVFMNALVQEKLQVFDYYTYRIGISMNEFSFSTALGIFKTVVSVTLLFFANWVAKKVRGDSII